MINFKLITCNVSVLILAVCIPLQIEAEEMQENIPNREDIAICDVEIKKLCTFKPTEIKSEQLCLNKNIANLSDQCRALVVLSADRRRPILLPKSVF